MALEYPNYGPADHVRFEDYPERIQIVVGSFLADETEMFTEGQPIVLYKTPKSGVAQGSYVVDEPLPDKRVVFTDTGEDDTFNLKITHYGWGEFYIGDVNNDDYLRLKMTKGMTVLSSEWEEEKVFAAHWYGDTRIPITDDLKQEFGYPISLEEEEIDAIIDDVIEDLDGEDLTNLDPKDVADAALSDELKYRMVYSPMAIQQNLMREIRRQAEHAVERFEVTEYTVGGKDEKDRKERFNTLWDTAADNVKKRYDNGQRYIEGIKVKPGYSMAFDHGY